MHLLFPCVPLNSPISSHQFLASGNRDTLSFPRNLQPAKLLDELVFLLLLMLEILVGFPKDHQSAFPGQEKA
jgi:hypothetical protein